MGLLAAAESKRIGAGYAGFSQVVMHPWFRTTDWVAMLRRQVPAPWVPPSNHEMLDQESVSFAGEEVMMEQPYDAQKWEATFPSSAPFVRHSRGLKRVCVATSTNSIPG